MRPRCCRLNALLSGALSGFAVTAALSACVDRTEPQPAPIVARRLGGDSMQPGPMVIICRPDDAGCVPTYAVACEMKWAGDSTQAGTVAVLSLSPAEQAWCAGQQRPDSVQRHEAAP